MHVYRLHTYDTQVACHGRAKLMRYNIPYGDKKVFFEAQEASVIFEEKMTSILGLMDLKGAPISALESPIGVHSLKNPQCSTRHSPQLRLPMLKQFALSPAPQ